MVESSPITTWFCTGWKVIQLSMEPPGIGVHILEVKAQLVDRPKTQRGDGDLRFAVQQPLQHRQAQDQFVHVLGAV